MNIKIILTKLAIFGLSENSWDLVFLPRRSRPLHHPHQAHQVDLVGQEDHIVVDIDNLLVPLQLV